MLKALFLFICGYYLFELLIFWVTLLASRRLKADRLPPSLTDADEKPKLVVIAPCRDAADCVSGLVECLKKQTYPSELFRIFILADNCSDNSAEMARSLGVEVYERRDSVIKTKGAAVNEILDRRLCDEVFDALTILDIDSRVDPQFLMRVASYIHKGSEVIQASLISKNPHENSLTRIGDAAQAMIRIQQQGRRALGLPAYLQGSGLTVCRSALERLKWHLGTRNHLTDDVEINIRCLLNDIFIDYAPNQRVVIELASNIKSLTSQERRWSASVIELAAHYFWPMLRKGFCGDWRTLESMFSVFLSPPFSVSFVVSSLTGVVLSGIGFVFPLVKPWAIVVLILAAVHGLYYLAALRMAHVPFSWGSFKSVVAFLWLRFITVCQAPFLAFFARGDRWAPMSHTADAAPKPSNFLKGADGRERGI